MLWGHTVSDLQSDVAVSGTESTGFKITGSLAYVSEGALPDVWGAGNFLALKFSNADPNAESLKVGLDPSEGSGLVELDEDMNAVCKITDKDVQKFVTEVKDGPTGNVTRTEYDLSELVCAES